MTDNPHAPPASQSEPLVEELRLIAVWHTPGPHRCSDGECPYIGQASPKSCGCHKSDEQMLKWAYANLVEALDKAATRFEHCAGMIAGSFDASGTLRAERTIKAKHYALEARAAIARATGEQP